MIFIFMVFRFALPPSRRHFKAIVLAVVMDGYQGMVVAFGIEVESLWVTCTNHTVDNVHHLHYSCSSL